MLQRLYVHNFRCLENFTLDLKGQTTALLVGANGSGKSSLISALQVFQSLARGVNRVRNLISPEDMARGPNSNPVRLELEVLLGSEVFVYGLSLELPDTFRELRVSSETLRLNGQTLFSRDIAQVQLVLGSRVSEFILDWHLLALPVIQARSDRDPIARFRQWLAEMILIAPIPSRIQGESQAPNLFPEQDLNNLGDWFSGILSQSMSALVELQKYLKGVMPELEDISNRPSGGEDHRSLRIAFRSGSDQVNLPFKLLSDGEKCQFICAMVLAANRSYGPRLCFWDEPDNCLAPQEVEHFIKCLQMGPGQFLMTSHNPLAIQEFAEEDVLVLQRRSRLEPTVVAKLPDLRANGTFSGDFVKALARGSLQ